MGTNRKRFDIHEGLICYQSAFFRRAFDGGFKESHEGALTLSDTSVETFEAFKDWMYLGQLFDEELDEKSKQRRTARLIEAWIFGESRGAPRFQNAAINLLFDDLVRLRGAILHDEDLDEIYEKTAENSPLRKFAVSATGFTTPNIAAFFR